MNNLRRLLMDAILLRSNLVRRAAFRLRSAAVAAAPFAEGGRDMSTPSFLVAGPVAAINNRREDLGRALVVGDEGPFYRAPGVQDEIGPGGRVGHDRNEFGPRVGARCDGEIVDEPLVSRTWGGVTRALSSYVENDDPAMIADLRVNNAFVAMTPSERVRGQP